MVNQISFVKYLDLGCHSCQLPHRHLTEIQRDVELMGISRRASVIFRGQGLPFAYLGKGWATYRWSKTTNNFWECRQGLQEGSMMNSMLAGNSTQRLLWPALSTGCPGHLAFYAWWSINRNSIYNRKKVICFCECVYSIRNDDMKSGFSCLKMDLLQIIFSSLTWKISKVKEEEKKCKKRKRKRKRKVQAKKRIESHFLPFFVFCLNRGCVLLTEPS